ncbi:unnamed protein product [Ceutorhynchus assimilis]|uniref:Uncharacterized protein n=1 Tax=Ceutorhynchus assimilis TaxID=467358 RepID=A0A9N9QG62_9CUCU|nr:unnamed protein product [Ceutorhynchus assimilis]
MTLPVALLIASYKQEVNQLEIRDLLDETDTSQLETLACKCKLHLNRKQLVPPTKDCLFEGVTPTSDLGSDISESTNSSGLVYTTKSYSLFSKKDQIEHVQTNDDIAEHLKVVLDLIENVNVRFTNSYLFKENEEIKINYQGRDILELGKNLQGGFHVTHPATGNGYSPSFYGCLEKVCTIDDCGFIDVFPLRLANCLSKI